MFHRIIIACLRTVDDLIRELGKDRFDRIHSGERFGQLNCPRFDGRKIETHMKVRRTASAFQIVDLHGMRGIGLKYFPVEDLIQIVLNFRIRGVRVPSAVVAFEKRSQRSYGTVYRDNTGAVVDRTRDGTVDAAEIDDQLSVYKQPEVIIAGELIDNIVSPVIFSVQSLCKGSRNLHSEAVIRRIVGIRFLNQIQLLILARICFRQVLRGNARCILIYGEYARGDIVIREEKTVSVGLAGTAVAAELLIDHKVMSIRIKMREILYAVVFKIS